MAKKKPPEIEDTRPGDPVSTRPEVKPDPKGDIDQRMAALLKDHQDMGARPK